MNGATIVNPSGMSVFVDGAPRSDLIRDYRTITGPNPYTAGGIPVDLSADFSEIIAVNVLRAYTTATKARDTRLYEVHEAGSDLFAAGKFRVQVFRAPTPAGTNGAPGTTTNANVLSASGAAANVTAINASTLTGSCVVGCDTDHPNGASAVTNLIQGSGAAKVTAVTAVTAPTFTGTAPSVALVEVGGDNLSGVSVQIEVVGVA